MFRVRQLTRWGIGVAVFFAADQAQAQSNLDASRSPAEIFSDACSACHDSARALKPTNAGFLRKHYTTGAKQAAAIAAFLETVANEPVPVVSRPRRPSDSIEQGKLRADPAPATAIETLAQQVTGEVPMPSRHVTAEFEE